MTKNVTIGKTIIQIDTILFTCKAVVLSMIVSVCAASSTAHAQSSHASLRSWSQFRGDQRNGSVQGLPTSNLRLQLLWEFPLPSIGVGGVAATDEMVVVSSRNINDDADLFFILDPEDGGIIVKHEVATHGRLDYGNSPRATPVVGPELVYVLGAFGDLTAIDPAEGKVRWQKHLTNTFGGRLPTWGYCASPLLHEGQLIVQPGGPDTQVVALDALDGQVTWKTPGTNRASYASPILLPAGSGSAGLVLGCDQAGLVAWSLAAGQEMWRLLPEASGEFMVPSPLLLERKLFWLGETNGLRAYQLDPNNGQRKPMLSAQNVDVVSDTHSPSGVAGSVVLVDDDHDLVALDPNDQLKIFDRFKHPAVDGYAAIITQEERALVCCTNGTLLLLKLSDGKWHKLDEKQPRVQTGKILAHPAFVDGKLYLRNDKSLSCYQLQRK